MSEKHVRKPEQCIRLFSRFQKSAKNFADLLPCPRCGRYTMKLALYTNATSRQFNIIVCDDCGTDEALAAFKNIPFNPNDWAIVISQAAEYPEVYIDET